MNKSRRDFLKALCYTVPLVSIAPAVLAQEPVFVGVDPATPSGDESYVTAFKRAAMSFTEFTRYAHHSLVSAQHAREDLTIYGGKQWSPAEIEDFTPCQAAQDQQDRPEDFHSGGLVGRGPGVQPGTAVVGS